MAELDKKPTLVALIFTVLTTISTAVGTFASSYLLIPMKMREEVERSRISRHAKGAQLRCDRLLEAASLAAKVRFSTSSGYNAGVEREALRREQLLVEERATALMPFLDDGDSELLHDVVLHHSVIVGMRTSDVPAQDRPTLAEGGFDANQELQSIRDLTHELGRRYRQTCAEEP